MYGYLYLHKFVSVINLEVGLLNTIAIHDYEQFSVLIIYIVLQQS